MSSDEEGGDELFYDEYDDGSGEEAQGELVWAFRLQGYPAGKSSTHFSRLL